jgi:hypothetical protein
MDALWTWIAAHPLQAVAAALSTLLTLIGSASVVIGLTPSQRIVALDVLGFCYRVVGRLSAVTPPDAPGSLKLPGWPVRVAQAAWDEWQASGQALVARIVATVRPPAPAKPSIPPSPLMHPSDPSLPPAHRDAVRPPAPPHTTEGPTSPQTPKAKHRSNRP